jgi:hypothetical protein
MNNLTDPDNENRNDRWIHPLNFNHWRPMMVLIGQRSSIGDR